MSVRSGAEITFSQKLYGIWQSIGPGLLFAGAAIGASHLVQSTRAGAGYGLQLLWVVIAVNILKLPFFEFGHRFTAATGRSLLYGYLRYKKSYLYIYFIMALITGILNTAGVTLVTGAMLSLLIDADLSLPVLSAVSLVTVGLILVIGRYALLDSLMKVMISVLAVFTLIAVIAAVNHGPAGDITAPPEQLFTMAGFSFLLALAGWMPAPIDISAWSSLWAVERMRQTGHRPELKESLIDFYTGYIITVILALAFVALGALVMYGTGESFSASGIQFSRQLVKLYTATLGDWSHWLISAIAFITMFSTTLTVVDGYTRTYKRSLELLIPSLDSSKSGNLLYLYLMLPLSVTAYFIITFFASAMSYLIDFATIIAFLSAPVFAWLNFSVIRSELVTAEYRPSFRLTVLSWSGLIFLVVFGILYIGLRLTEIISGS